MRCVLRVVLNVGLCVSLSFLSLSSKADQSTVIGSGLSQDLLITYVEGNRGAVDYFPENVLTQLNAHPDFELESQPQHEAAQSDFRADDPCFEAMITAMEAEDWAHVNELLELMLENND